MKLYTEEQLFNTVNAVRYYEETYDEKIAEERIEKHLKALEPIELNLPSDEEIDQYINSFPYTKHLDDGQYNDGVMVGAELAIEWYREQLKKKTK